MHKKYDVVNYGVAAATWSFPLSWIQVRPDIQEFVGNRPDNARFFVILPRFLRFSACSERYWAVCQTQCYKVTRINTGTPILYGIYPDFCPDSTRNLPGFSQKKSSEFFTKMSSDEELITLHFNHTRNHWNNTVYTLYLDALYGVLMQCVLLYCDFVTILSRFTLFCSDLRCFFCDLRCFVATTWLFRPFPLTFTHFFCRILSWQTFTRFL